MRFVLFAIGLLAIIGDVWSENSKPNVLFIAVDDLNDWIGCLDGHPQAQTPNIDRLAARGVLFTNAHCAAPACNPSRAALFSGLMPHETKVWANKNGSIYKDAPNAVLLPQAFAKAGYRTLGAGKLIGKSESKGFEKYFDTEQRWSPVSADAVEYPEDELPSKGTDNPRHVTKDSLGREVVLPLNRMPSDRAPESTKGESFDWGPWDVPDTDFGDTRITNWAIGQIEQKREKPMFLAVGYYRPHIPLWAPKRFFKRFQNDPGKLPLVKTDDLDDLSDAAKDWAIKPVTAGSHSTVLKHDQWRQAVEAYLVCVSYVDYEIGRLLDALDRSSAADNTVVVLWSDHGWQLGEKQHWGKWTGWERSTRVPMIVVPAKSASSEFADTGSRCDQPTGLIDLYPTLLDLCEVSGPGNLSGVSLVPLLKNPDASTGRHLVTLFNPGNVSVRSDQYRFIQYAEGSYELYDLHADPNEWTNLSRDPGLTKIRQTLANTAGKFAK